MDVTLKKAAELSRSLIAAAKAVKPVSKVTVSAFSTFDVTESLTEARGVFEGMTEQVGQYLTAAYGIRSAISTANSFAGINKLMTEAARIDAMIETIEALSPPPRSEFADEIASDDLDAVGRQVEDMRLAVTTARDPALGRRKESLTIDIGEATRLALAERIVALKRERAKVKDQITALNFNTTVGISTDEESALRLAGIID